MLTATLVLLTAGQGSPVERFSSFLKNADQLTMSSNVKFENVSYETRLIWDIGPYQYFEIVSPNGKEKYWQIPERILGVSEAEGQYWEYKGPEHKSPPPPNLGAAFTLYPIFLLQLAAPNGLKDLKVGDKVKIRQREYESVFISRKGESSSETITVVIDEFGIPQQFQFIETSQSGQLNLKYEVTSLNTNPTKLKQWKYQPPTGLMPGEIPYTGNPLGSGYQAKLGTWKKGQGGSVNVRDMNKKGIVVLFTADDCEPSKKASGAFEKLKKALDQIGVNFVEVRLGRDADNLQRNWAVVTDTDGKLENQFQPPVTPYLYAIDSKSIVLGGWAGYAKDQDQALVNSIVGRFQSDEEE